MDGLRERHDRIEEKVLSACLRSGRSRDEITLVAVSKGRSAEEIVQLNALGVNHFGENRLPEFLQKKDRLPSPVHLHFIGPLQSNKAKKIAENFQTVHTLATLSSAEELGKSGRKPTIFVQVNVGREVQKSGILSDQVESFLESSLQYLPGGVFGLMTIGPQALDPEQSRRLFRSLYVLAEKHGLKGLSMGMSEDFEWAIEEGATHIRVGSALFGPPLPC
jgi:PLP dependent protein